VLTAEKIVQTRTVWKGGWTSSGPLVWWWICWWQPSDWLRTLGVLDQSRDWPRRSYLKWPTCIMFWVGRHV